jgi:hypothetical protein
MLEAVIGQDRMLRLGELRYLQRLRILPGECCSCGEALDKCEFWTVIAPAAITGNEQEIYTALFNRAKSDENIAGLVESSKTTRGSYLRPRLIKKLCDNYGIDFYFVHLLRNPDAVLESLEKGSNEAMRSRKEDIKPSIAPYIAMLIMWPLSNLFAAFTKYTVGPDRYCAVTYENIEHSRSLARLLQNINGSTVPVELDFTTPNVHQVGGNRMSRQVSQPLKIADKQYLKRGINIFNRFLYRSILRGE